MGLLGGVQVGREDGSLFAPEAGVGYHFAARCIEHGLLSRASCDCLALCPPLIITRPEIDEIFDIITRALDDTLDYVNREQLLVA